MVACQRPRVNMEAIVQLGGQPVGQILQSFGMTIGPSVLVVPGRVLPTPNVVYSANAAAINDHASWNLVGVEFAVGARFDRWAILVIKDGSPCEFADAQDPELFNVVNCFRGMCNTCGMHVASDPTYTEVWLPRNGNFNPMPERQSAILEAIKTTLLKVKPKPDLVMVMLPSGDKAVYDGIKYLCDVLLDVATVCVHSSKIRKCNPQYLASVAMKVNTKMGGINHKLDPNTEQWLAAAPTMVVGMDVTHPRPGSARGTPSVAAVVASVDSHFAHYPASLEIQETRKEMISNLKNMMVDRLKLFQSRNNGNLPRRILVYRTGVSLTQIDALRSCDLPCILEAFHAFSTPEAQYRPMLTMIICSKSRRTWFCAGDGNPRPGTVVDRDVTSVYDFDFYLQAHGGLQGTTRPTHYTVIHDEIGVKADEIQGVTHSLSYMFAPATQAVSLVSPAYYADIASKRGFCYLRCGRYSENSDWTSTAEEEVTMTEANLTEARRVWYTVGGVPGRKLSDTMFYI